MTMSDNFVQRSINRECGHDFDHQKFLNIVSDPKTDSFWEVWQCNICYARNYIELGVKT